MYYLLEDNRIIDTSKALHNVDEIIIEENENEKYLYLVGWLGKHFCGKIKKQSENVYDLIENEDLIKIRFGDSFNILEACHIGGGVNGMTNITTIYKPDSNGNYIKAWEKKGE